MTMGSRASNPQGAGRRAAWMRNGFLSLWLALLVGVTILLAIGGPPDPAGLGRPLDGLWRFHPGDDPAWADPALDDRGWDRITLVSRPELNDGDVGIPGYFDGWRAHGHPDLSGYGWYRREVALPAKGDVVLLGPPIVDDGYQMFWNGRPIGGIGRLSGTPKVNATRPWLAYLPASNGARTGLLAIRAYMQPGERDGKSGGLRTVPIVAPRVQGEALHRAQWRRTIAGYVVDAAEPVAMLVLAAMAILAAPRLTRPEFARWIALGLVASACLRAGNAIGAWTDLRSQTAQAWQNAVIFAPLAKLGWTMAWNRWADGRERRFVSVAALAGWGLATFGALIQSAEIGGTARAVFALGLVVIAVRILRHGKNRLLALGTLLLTATGLFAADLSALGVPGIWFPFNIGVSRSQYAYALALPLLALALFTPERAEVARGHSLPHG
jgi:hypothetical protein